MAKVPSPSASITLQALASALPVICIDRSGTVVELSDKAAGLLNIDAAKGRGVPLHTLLGIAASQTTAIWDNTVSAPTHLSTDGVHIEFAAGDTADSQSGYAVGIVRPHATPQGDQQQQDPLLSAVNANYGIIRYSSQGVIQHCNDNVAQWFDSAEDGLIGSTFAASLATGDAEDSDLWRLLRKGQTQHRLLQRAHEGSDAHWVQSTFVPNHSGGRVVSVTEIAMTTDEEVELAFQRRGRADAADNILAVIEFAPDGQVVFANDNFLATTGYARDEIIGKNHRIFVRPGSEGDEEYHALWKALREGNASSGAVQRFRKDGAPVWLDATYQPVKDNHGNLVRVVKVAKDVTQEREDATHAASLSGMVEQAQACVMMCNTDRVITYCNPSVLTLLNRYEPQLQKHFPTLVVDRLVGMSIDIFHRHPEHQARILSDATRLPYRTTIRLDGMEFDLCLSMLKDQNGNWIGNAVEWLDQTPRALLRKSLASAADGDLTATIDATFEGDYEVLKQGLNDTLSGLADIVRHVRTTVDAFTVETTAIVDQTKGVAQQTERLGNTADEMSANVEELTASIASIASGSNSADGIAQNTLVQAEKGAEAIREALAAMKDIQGSSEEVQEIVKVIDEIASQTNLLAFNAAIEAARAGVHGRGFAVVADEVRKLAERSSKATHQIGKLIQESTRRVERGSEVSGHASSSFESIAESVRATSSSVTQIASAAAEQSMAAQEVNQGVQSVSVETENAAHATERIATACSALSDKADKLQEALRAIKVD